ncbi:MAG: DUF885 domain-containing protein [Stackebrandtia sp.]
MSSALSEIGEDYFAARMADRPLHATVYGIPGHDARVPDPSREADARMVGVLRDLEDRLAGVDESSLDAPDRLTRRVLAAALRDKRDIRGSVAGDVAVSATVMGAFSGLLATVPAANLHSEQAALDYQERLRGLEGFFEALGRRHLAAAADGLFPTATGARQLCEQIDGYLSKPVDADPFLRPQPPESVDAETWRAKTASVLNDRLRPALARYRDLLAAEVAPHGRDDDHVGICHVDGGPRAYQTAVRVETTTDLTPETLHRTGLELIAELRAEFAERGGRVLGVSDVPEVLRRLREDPKLRFGASGEIVDTVSRALRAAQEALPDWFRRYDIAECVVREMDPAEAENGVLAYYLPPAADGGRPGTHVVNSYRPDTRTRFEYEALAFHESVPGHHLQIAVAQSLKDLPQFRRFEMCTAYTEGWGLYSERLSDEMGLYSDELSRLGMVSFDAWRASRLVVDTGMHHHGWSRRQAIDYMRDNTALSTPNIVNEVDRYIAAPGQALAYMTGRLKIQRLRERSRAALGPDFDIRRFHDAVLGNGSLPLDVLDDLVADSSL